MKAMILAAGRGERLRPLTDHTPKPLLPVAGRPLIEYTIEALVAAGFTELVINLAHLGEQIKDRLADGRRYGADIEYSDEGGGALETAGGIIHALPLLGKEPFVVVNGDIATGFPLSTLKNKRIDLAHLVLTPNPDHHLEGDFALEGDRVRLEGPEKYTFSGIGIYRPALFADLPPGKQRLAPILRRAIEQDRVSGEFYDGFWMDIGSRQRLKELESLYQKRRK
ncbi:MAG: N-acetylmuramate alpha-1-phosphate uridylyltransferase MurU [Gammaproteobacteria bacterium]